MQEFLNIFSTNQENVIVPYGILEQFPACYITPWRRIIHHVETVSLSINISHVIVMQLVNKFLLQRTGFNSWTVQVGFILNRVAEGQVPHPSPLPWVPFLFSQFSFYYCYNLIHYSFIQHFAHPPLQGTVLSNPKQELKTRLR